MKSLLSYYVVFCDNVIGFFSPHYKPIVPGSTNSYSVSIIQTTEEADVDTVLPLLLGNILLSKLLSYDVTLLLSVYMHLTHRKLSHIHSPGGLEPITAG